MCLAAVTCSVLTGCWDRLEIEQRAVVLGLAVDGADPGELRRMGSSIYLDRTPHGRDLVPLRLTAQIAVPGRIPLGPGDAGGGGGQGSGGSQGSGGDRRPVWVLRAVGYTLEDAVSNLQQQVADPLFFGHLRILVISEAMARKGVTGINDWLRRNPNIRRTLWFTVAKGDAADVMEAAPELERVPTFYLWAMFDQAQHLGKLPPSYSNVFWRAYSCTGQEPFLPFVEIRQRNNVFIRGLAYFKGDRMIGSLDSPEVGLFMVVKGFKPAGYLAFVQGAGSREHVLVEVLHTVSKIAVEEEGGRPRIKIRSHLEVAIREKPGSRLDVGSLRQVRELEETLAHSVEREVMRLIRKTQGEGADIFGFGEQVRARMFSYWKQKVRTKQDWEALYPSLPVRAEVTVNIRRIGTLNR
ncbi:MAG: Ger(x)C family spore germination protein [Alicyclobacillaceae bacterium]|nr:Ger(x)C family spore germination protein [Alicyclobacillaceae bacterium]